MRLLRLAIQAPWERGLDRRRHVILMFTDASAHPLGAVVRIIQRALPRSIARSEDELSEQWGYQSSQSAVMENSAKRLILFAPDLEPSAGDRG